MKFLLKGLSIWYLINILSFSVDTSIITKVKIPQYVILGSTVHLYCVFDLQNGTDLYMLKWLKNGKEFYRSVPKALLRPNRRRMFHVEGVKVDIENSKVRIMKNCLFFIDLI